jgi:hypothetical protein
MRHQDCTDTTWHCWVTSILVLFWSSCRHSTPLCLWHDGGQQAHGARDDGRRDACAGQRAAAALNAAAQHVLAKCDHIRLRVTTK